MVTATRRTTQLQRLKEEIKQWMITICWSLKNKLPTDINAPTFDTLKQLVDTNPKPPLITVH